MSDQNNLYTKVITYICQSAIHVMSRIKRGVTAQPLTSHSQTWGGTLHTVQTPTQLLNRPHRPGRLKTILWTSRAMCIREYSISLGCVITALLAGCMQTSWGLKKIKYNKVCVKKVLKKHRPWSEKAGSGCA